MTCLVLDVVLLLKVRAERNCSIVFCTASHSFPHVSKHVAHSLCEYYRTPVHCYFDHCNKKMCCFSPHCSGRP